MSELALFGGSPIRTKSFPSWPRTSDEIREHVLDTLNNEKWGVGSKTIAEFNDNFSSYHDAKYCISLHSGTSALWVAFWNFSDLTFTVMVGIVVIIFYNTTLTQWLWIGGLTAVPDRKSVV